MYRTTDFFPWWKRFACTHAHVGEVKYISKQDFLHGVQKVISKTSHCNRVWNESAHHSWGSITHFLYQFPMSALPSRFVKSCFLWARPRKRKKNRRKVAFNMATAATCRKDYGGQRVARAVLNPPGEFQTTDWQMTEIKRLTCEPS